MELTNIRTIIPPVANVTARTEYNTIVRRKRALDYAKANQRWWIQVHFNSDIDLMIFEKAIQGSSIRLTELGGNFYLEDPSVPDSAPVDVPFRYGEEGLLRLNAAIQLVCTYYIPARFYCVIELFSNGTGRGIVSQPFRVHGTNEDKGIVGFLQGPPSRLPAIISLSAQNADVREALFYFGATDNVWGNLYKAREVVEETCGGQKALVENGWCTRNSWERFSRTANHQEAIGRFSRHARSAAQPPPDPMSEHDARVFVGSLLNGWITNLLAAESTPSPTA